MLCPVCMEKEDHNILNYGEDRVIYCEHCWTKWLAVPKTFLIHFSDYFRGFGQEVWVLLEALDREHAVKQFAIQYLKWDKDEPELNDKEKMEKHFFEGEVLTEVFDIQEQVKDLQEKHFIVLHRESTPG